MKGVDTFTQMYLDKLIKAHIRAVKNIEQLAYDLNMPSDEPASSDKDIQLYILHVQRDALNQQIDRLSVVKHVVAGLENHQTLKTLEGLQNSKWDS